MEPLNLVLIPALIIYLFIYLLSKYLMITYYVSGTVAEPEDTMVKI